MLEEGSKQSDSSLSLVKRTPFSSQPRYPRNISINSSKLISERLEGHADSIGDKTLGFASGEYFSLAPLGPRSECFRSITSQSRIALSRRDSSPTQPIGIFDDYPSLISLPRRNIAAVYREGQPTMR